MKARSRRSGERGSEIIEFSLSMMFLIPVFVAMVALGLNVSRSVQVTTIARDAGHMYARFVDFSLTANKNLVVRLANGMDMTVAGGNGVVRLSKITYIGDADCTGAGLTLGACTNRNFHVVIHRINIGNNSLQASQFGTPNVAGMDAQGNVLNYLTDTTARAGTFSSLLTLQSGQFAFASEAFFTGFAFTLPYGSGGDDIYARAIF